MNQKKDTEAKSAYEIMYDRLTQSKDFDEQSLDILLKLKEVLNRNYELKE